MEEEMATAATASSCAPRRSLPTEVNSLAITAPLSCLRLRQRPIGAFSTFAAFSSPTAFTERPGEGPRIGRAVRCWSDPGEAGPGCEYRLTERVLETRPHG